MQVLWTTSGENFTAALPNAMYGSTATSKFRIGLYRDFEDWSSLFAKATLGRAVIFV
jgi:hypothetical protein